MRYLWAAAALLAALFFSSLFIDPYSIEVTENHFAFFDSAATPVKAVFISDTQSAYDHPEFFSRFIDTVNAQEPDVIFLGGDIVEGEAKAWEKIDDFAKLKAKHGVYAILGNHDYQNWDCTEDDNEYADKIAAKLESMGIKVLRNQNELIDISGRAFTLIGVDDVWACRSDYPKAAQGIGPEPSIVLVHNTMAVANEKLPH